MAPAEQGIEGGGGIARLLAGSGVYGFFSYISPLSDSGRQCINISSIWYYSHTQVYRHKQVLLVFSPEF